MHITPTDFPWRKEEQWMELERLVREGLKGNYHDYQEACIERLRRVFDAIWIEWEFNYSGPPDGLGHAIERLVDERCRPIIVELFKAELRNMDLEGELRRLRDR